MLQRSKEAPLGRKVIKVDAISNSQGLGLKETLGLHEKEVEND